MKKLSCRETGFNWDYVIKVETDEEIFRKGEQHDSYAKSK